MENEKLVELTADIVAAHVTNNMVAVGDIATLVQRVHEALSSLGAAADEGQRAAKTPIVSVRSSIKPDFIVCLECGGKHKMLKRHLMNAHNVTPDQYRADYGLPRDYPMVAPNYSEQRRSLAHAIGLGRRRPPPAQGGESGGGAAGAKPAPKAGGARGRRKS